MSSLLTPKIENIVSDNFISKDTSDFDIYDQGIINILDITLKLAIEKKGDLDCVYQTIFWVMFEDYIIN